MRNPLRLFLNLLSSVTGYSSVVHLLLTALLLILLGSTACSNPPTNSFGKSTPPASQSTPSAKADDVAVMLPSQVAKETNNPLPDLAVAALAGKPLYQANCSLCHGAAGAGDGLASASFDPPPTSLIEGEVTTDPDGELFLITKNGKGKMPAMKRMTDEQIWQVVAYVRTLAKKQ